MEKNGLDKFDNLFPFCVCVYNFLSLLFFNSSKHVYVISLKTHESRCSVRVNGGEGE